MGANWKTKLKLNSRPTRNAPSIHTHKTEHDNSADDANFANCAIAILANSRLPDVDTQIAYKPASGERWPFLRARLELCALRCTRMNLTVRLQLAASPQQNWRPDGGASGPLSSSEQAAPRVPTRLQRRQSIRRQATLLGPGAAGANQAHLFHCDRDPYAMVSKRRLCGKCLACGPHA